MIPITEDAVRELAGFKGRQAPVASLYLDVDGRHYPRHQDYETELTRLMRRTREQSDPVTLKDLQRIEEYVKAGLDRSRVRGLAIFSCSNEELWKVFELPVPVRNQLVLNHTPHVRQLEYLLSTYQKFGVLLVDRQRARVLLFHLGVLVDKSELFDQLPRHDDDGGEWDKDHVRDHADAVVHRHLRRAAQVAFSLYQGHGYERLVIACPEELTGELEKELHSYLRERIAGRVALPVTASDAEIRQAAIEIVEQAERKHQAVAVDKLRAAVGSGNSGVGGLDATLGALVEHRVDTLLVSDGYEAPGWRCPACSYLGPRGRACPLCGGTMDMVEDVVEEAIEEALTQSCKVLVCSGNADLDVLGRIGALTRF